jgi:hypothetical protein
MITVYKRLLSATQIRKEAKKAIRDIAKWFEQNPKRRVCKAELWYGKIISIKRATIEKQIETAVNETGK